MYKPEPVDTSNVAVSEEILLLREKIAKNVHDVWAVGRMREGWVYGEKRDDEKKTSPCLVPYEELSEEEKAEQAALRKEYIAEIRASFGATLDNTVIQYPDGSRKSLKKDK